MCVRIDAIGISGAATRPMKKMYMMRPPSVISPAMIARPPSQIISTPTMPTTTVLPAVVAETPVSDLAMLPLILWL